MALPQLMARLEPSLPESIVLALGRELMQTEIDPAGRELLPAGATLDRARLLLSGWACRTRTLADGRRQIIDFYLPGDILGYCGRPDGRTAASFVALTEVRSASATRILQLLYKQDTESRALRETCFRLEALQEQFLLNQLVRMGRLTAYERVAHLLLEFHYRLGMVQLAGTDSFRLPLTQEMLADGLGLSIVHVNRTLQSLKRDGRIRANGAVVTLIDVGALGRLCDFHIPVWQKNTQDGYSSRPQDQRQIL